MLEAAATVRNASGASPSAALVRITLRDQGSDGQPRGLPNPPRRAVNFEVTEVLLGDRGHAGQRVLAIEQRDDQGLVSDQIVFVRARQFKGQFTWLETLECFPGATLDFFGLVRGYLRPPALNQFGEQTERTDFAQVMTYEQFRTCVGGGQRPECLFDARDWTLPPLKAEVFTSLPLNPSTMATLLAHGRHGVSFLSRRGAVTHDDSKGVLWVMDSAARLEAIRLYLEELARLPSLPAP